MLFCYLFLKCSMISSQTTPSIVALLSGPLVGTPECVSYVMLCCIYVAGLIEAGLFTTSGLCIGSLLPGIGAVQGLLVYVVCYVYDCSVLVLGGGGGGWIYQPVVGGGVLLIFFL